MRLGIVVPSRESLGHAGVRIRYQRIAPELARRGWRTTIRVIDDIEGPGDLADDVLLISKCAKPTALVLAGGAVAAGVRVGVDLFDDYFSQPADGRFGVRRLWLTNMAAMADFAIASTPRMAAVARDWGFGRTHVMNDPGPGFVAAAVCEVAARKQAEALRSNRLRIAWFGVGDNQHFPVGLHDLAAFGHALAPFAQSGFICDLEILSNRRALVADTLARLRRLPVPYVIGEWSEDAERALLDRCHVSFLPVNAQPFSTAKSLNRAVTAIAAGAQVLTVGHDLYRPLAAFLYHDAHALLSDLRSGTPRLAPPAAQALGACMEAFADREVEAARLAAFLDAVLATPAPGGPARGPVGLLVHGHIANVDAHRAARRWNMLSVGTPLTTKRLDFDLRLEAGPGERRLRALLAKHALRHATPALERTLRPHGRIGDVDYLEICVEPPAPVALRPGGVGADAAAVYAETMAACLDLLGRLFPDAPRQVAESAVIPLPMVSQAQIERRGVR